MRSLKQKVLSNTIWGGLDAVVEFVVPTVVSILVARAMGPTKLGAWGYVVWIAMMARVLGDFGVSLAVRKYIGQYFGKKDFGTALTILRYAVGFQVLIGIALTGAGLGWVHGYLPPEQRTFGTIAVVSIFPAALMGIASGMNDTMERLHGNVIPSIVGVLTHAGVSIATLVLNWDLEGLAAALLVSTALDTSLRWLLVRRSLVECLGEAGITRQSLPRRVAISDPLWRDMRAFCMNATILLVLRMVVWMRSEVFFLERFCSLEQLAFYSVAIGFSELPMKIAFPFSRAAVASLYAERGRSVEGARRFAALFWRYHALMVLPTSAGLCILSGPLIRTLYGPQYYAAAPVLFWALALGFLGPLQEPATNLVTAGNGQKYLVRWNIVAAVVVLTLDVVLVRSHCATGGAIAMGLGRLVTTIGVWEIARRWFGFELPVRFGLRLFAATLGMALTVWLVMLLSGDLLALLLGPATGMVTFPLWLRLLRPLVKEDVDRLGAAQSLLPGRLRPPYRFVLNWVARG